MLIPAMPSLGNKVISRYLGFTFQTLKVENADSELLTNGSDQSQTSYISDSNWIKQYAVHKFLVESKRIRLNTIETKRLTSVSAGSKMIPHPPIYLYWTFRGL